MVWEMKTREEIRKRESRREIRKRESMCCPWTNSAAAPSLFSNFVETVVMLLAPKNDVLFLGSDDGITRPYK